MAAGQLEAARKAYQRLAYRDAADLYAQADHGDDLTAEDLVALAESYWWTGRMRRCIGARERAYGRWIAAGEEVNALMAAVQMALHHHDINQSTVSKAWARRAEALASKHPDTAAAGWHTFLHAYAALAAGDVDAAEQMLAQCLSLAAAHHDPDLDAYATMTLGHAARARGDVARSWALMEEVTIAAVSGGLGPKATGYAYCSMISTCAELADLARAGEWTEAATRWCERQSIEGFPGICRVHHAEVLRLRGALAEAERDATSAVAELTDWDVGMGSFAYAELGLVRLRLGDLAGAEEALRLAHEMGREDPPELALLHLRRGDAAGAARVIRRALGAVTRIPSRVKLLPVAVEAFLAAGETAAAREHADELRAALPTFTGPGFAAASAHADAAVAVAEGDLPAALDAAGSAVRQWRDLDAPYEAACARCLLAETHVAAGDLDLARLEWETARKSYERIGAAPDVVAVDGRLRSLDTGRTQSRVATTLMFTDIVKSTNLLEAIGDVAWTHLLRWHDTTLRRVLTDHLGKEVSYTGDGFFASFDTPRDAVACAVAIQHALDTHRREHGFAPSVRIGLHACEATQSGENFQGMGVHAAARIGALADAEEILASSDTLDGLDVDVDNQRRVELKGIAKPLDVVRVLWREV